MEKACMEDGVVLKKDDVRRLYHAFLSLCDYVEENIYCANCPLYGELCGNKDEANVELFSKSLKNIRDKCGIKKPGYL
ncbi:hypothetical protein [uncultured Oscillibacter sp.]|uniref:hypothetical protein n=1 Tax=uncultured Oscillibacter sp. TaxID=876091 RepID=UPI002610D856|nr:hypothetical protein [uncultured Oscillibacter sp.]